MSLLDFYIRLFDNLNWNISDISDITFKGSNLPLNQDPRFQEFFTPLTSGPIQIYYPDEYGNKNGEDIGFEYPAGLRGIDILGAISTFYNSPIDEKWLAELKQTGEIENFPSAVEKIRRGQTPTHLDFLGNHVLFKGIRKSLTGNYYVRLSN